jgi:O-antigen/teichoic acid export membrane protein
LTDGRDAVVPPLDGIVDNPDLLDTRAAGPAAIRGSALRAGGYFLGILLSLASAPLLIRHLGQADFGRYFTVVSLIAIVIGLTEGGLNAIAVREYTVLAGTARDHLMGNLLGIRLALSVVGALVAVGFAGVAGYGSQLVLGTVLAAIGMVFQTTQTMLVAPLQSSLRFGWVSATELLRQIVTVALIVALVLAGAGLVALLGIPIVAGLVTLAATALLVRRLMTLRPRFELGVWRQLLGDTLTYAVAIALNALYLRITVVVMSLVTTSLETGYFSTSFRVVEVVIGVPALVIGAAFPILARAARDDRSRFIDASRRMFELSVIVGSWIVVCIEIGAPFAIKLLGGSQAEPAIEILRIQGPALLATFVAVACGYPLLSLRRHRELLIANALALLASVGLTLTLAPSFAGRGAAVATVSAEFALAAATAVLLSRSQAGLRLPLSVVPVALVAAGAALLPGLLLPVHPIIGTLVATLIYAGVLFALGRFPPELAHAIATRRA